MEKIKRADNHLFYKGDRIINFRPVLCISLSFGLGIFLSFLIGYSAFWLNLVVIPVGIFLLLHKNSAKSFHKILFVLVLAVFYSIGAISFVAKISAFEKDPEILGKCFVSGEVFEIGDGGSRTILTVENLHIVTEKGVTVFPDGNMSLYLYGDSGQEIEIGSHVVCECSVTTYDAWAYGRINTSAILSGTRYFASVNSENLIISEGNGKSVFVSVRSRLRETLFSSTDASTASIAYALLVGDSGYMDQDVLQNFRYGGIAHIFAVSGLHIGLLYGMLYFLVKRLRIRGVLRVTIVFLVLLFYTGVCGFSPSSVRALIMCTVLMIADTGGYQYDWLNSVSLAFLLVLILNPVYLFSVGFQLSIAAAAGIIVLGGHLGRLLSRVKFLPKKLASALSVSVSAQISTFPLLLDSFGYVSAISLVLNLLFVPIISAVYSILFLCMLPAILFPAAGTVILYLPCLLLQFAVTPILMLDFKILLICGFSFGSAAILWYILLFLVSDKVNLKLVPKMIASGILAVILSLVMVFQNGTFYYDGTITVHSYYGDNAVIFKSDDRTALLLVGSPDPVFVERLFLQEGVSYIDDLIVLSETRDINTAVPIVLKFAKIGMMHVWAKSEFVDTFQTLEIQEENSFFRMGNSNACFMGNEVLYLNFLGADILICGEEVNENLPDCDVLIAPIYEEELFSECEPEVEIYFEKTEGKMNVYSAGDLQIGLKNDIIKVKKAE